MKSFKNHVSLIIALFAILLTLQTFLSLERVIKAYEHKLSDNYAVIIVSEQNLTLAAVQRVSGSIRSIEQLSPAQILSRLQQNSAAAHINLMELQLPNFYRLRLDHYPNPSEIQSLGLHLERLGSIERVETFARQHDTIHRLLSLFKHVVLMLAGTLFLVTSLLIAKEMRIWQFQHMERMQIMTLFGSTIFLRSAVLFRLAIVDAIIATLIAAGVFGAVEHYGWGAQMLAMIRVEALLFDPAQDLPLLLGVAMLLSVLLAFMIITGQRDEV